MPVATVGALLNTGSVAQANVRALPLHMRIVGPPVETVQFVGRVLCRRLGRDRPEDDGHHIGMRVWVRPQPHWALPFEDEVSVLFRDHSGNSGVSVVLWV